MPSRTTAVPDLERATREVAACYQLANSLGHPFRPQARVLEIGCGHGQTTLAFRRSGIEAYGVDVLPHWTFSPGVCTEIEAIESDTPILQAVDLADYKFPFPDAYFDFVFSNMVFEHAQNYPEVFAEVSRVMKPGGFSLHVFPSRYLPIEPHVHVPLGTMLQSYPYLRFWAALGIRNSYQRGFRPRATALRNHVYLTRRTTYYTMKQIRSLAAPYFGDISIASAAYGRTRYTRKRHLYRLLRWLPAANLLGNTLLERVLLLREPRAPSPTTCAA